MTNPNLFVDVNPDSFAQKVSNRITDNYSILHQLLRQTLIEELEASIRSSFTSDEIIGIKFTGGDRINAHSIQEAIDDEGYAIKNLNIQLDLQPGLILSEDDIVHPSELQLKSFFFGPRRKAIKFKHKKMKTRERYIIKLLEVIIPARILNQVYKSNLTTCNCSDELLRPVHHEVWVWWQQFVCILCGRRFFCDCFKSAIEKYVKVAEEKKSHYAKRGWPYRFLEAVSNTTYRQSICHLCTGKPSDLFFCHPMYGSAIRVKYGAYMKKFEIDEDLSEREAENRVRELIGVPKIGEGWVSETQLYHLVESLFSEYEVVREASPEWLGAQRFDIYVPELNLAVEYQGEQHYHPVDLFGGEAGYKATQERDKRKADLCKENDATLVYFSYKDDLSQENVESKLSKYLPKKQ